MPVRGLYKDKATGLYRFDFWINGHRFRGTTETADRREAERIVRARRIEARGILDQETGRAAMTFAVASSRWYQEAGRFRKKPHEVERYLAWLQVQVGNATPIAGIDDNVLTRLVSLRRAERVGHATINRTVIEPLRAILRRADLLWGQRVARIQWKAHLLKEPRERVRELSQAEEEAFLAAARPDYRPVFAFAILSALRMSEIVGLRWEHVDWGGRRIHVVGKGNEVASIPLSLGMERILRQVQADQNAGPIWLYQPRRRETGKVTDLTPRPVTAEGLKTEFRRARARAGLPSSRENILLGFRFHDQRHTAVTRLVRQTGNLKLGQKLARHATIATTTKYAHATEDDLRRAMDATHGPLETPHPATGDGNKRKGLKAVS